MPESAVTTKKTTRKPVSPGVIATVLFVAALVLRLVYAVQLKWPPLDDPAYYIQAARSLYHHGNLDLAIIWNFNPNFPAIIHPGMEFWQPLSSYVIAFSFMLLGDNYFATQLPSIIAGAFLPPIAYLFTRRLDLARSERLALLSGFITLFSLLLVYQSALPDSTMLYSALGAGALLLLTKPQNQPLHPPAALAFGLLAGLAYLTRTPALFLFLAWFILLLPRFRAGYLQLWRPQPGKGTLRIDLPAFRNLPNWLELACAGVVIIFLAAIWAARNLSTYGFISSPAGTQTIFLFDYASLFNYTDPVSLQTMLAGGFNKILGVRLEAIGTAWSVLNGIFPPTALPAAIGLAMLAWRRPAARPAALYTILLFLGLPLIFGVASTNGSYYHSAGSSAPFLAAGSVYALQALADWVGRRVKVNRRMLFDGLIYTVLVLELALLVIGMPGVVDSDNKTGEMYGRIAEWLRAHPAPAVIASQPASLNYANGVPAVRLPLAQDLTVLTQVARQYNARYIIITEKGGLYPEALQAASNKLFPLAYRSPSGDFEIYSAP